MALLKSGYSYNAVKSNTHTLSLSGIDSTAAYRQSCEHARKHYFRKHPCGLLPEWLAHPKEKRSKNDYDVDGKYKSTLHKNPRRRKTSGQTARGNGRISGEIEQARQLGYDFSGHDPKLLKRMQIPDAPKVLLQVGTVLGIIYQAQDGRKLKNFIHKFTLVTARPLLTVTPNGKQLVLVGGEYEFTDRGIEDKRY